MLRLIKYSQRCRTWISQPPRQLSTEKGDETVCGATPNLDKVVEFFKKADEKVASESAKGITESTFVTKSPPMDPEFSPSNKGAYAERRQSSAPRLVPWTSNRFSKECRIVKGPNSSTPRQENFVTMLRESTFVQLGNFNQREVIGVVIENVNDSDLYVDIGGKFLTVVSQPGDSFYPRGSLVRVRLRDPEMANRFMLNTRAISLLEADTTLLGPYRGQLVTSRSDNIPAVHEINKEVVSLEHWKLS